MICFDSSQRGLMSVRIARVRILRQGINRTFKRILIGSAECAICDNRLTIGSSSDNTLSRSVALTWQQRGLQLRFPRNRPLSALQIQRYEAASLGLEPRTTESESAVLPITPRGSEL